jgi:transcription antitermination factor NusG
VVKPESASWYAVQTRARNEKVVCERLQEQGLSTFLPLVTEVRRWSDRKKKVELPLFSCYVFVRCSLSAEDRTRVYRVESALGFVGQ